MKFPVIGYGNSEIKFNVKHFEHHEAAAAALLCEQLHAYQKPLQPNCHLKPIKLD